MVIHKVSMTRVKWESGFESSPTTIFLKGKLAHKFSTCYLECISYHLPMDKKFMAEKLWKKIIYPMHTGKRKPNLEILSVWVSQQRLILDLIIGGVFEHSHCIIEPP